MNLESFLKSSYPPSWEMRLLYQVLCLCCLSCSWWCKAFIWFLWKNQLFKLFEVKHISSKHLPHSLTLSGSYVFFFYECLNLLRTSHFLLSLLNFQFKFCLNILSLLSVWDKAFHLFNSCVTILLRFITYECVQNPWMYKYNSLSR